MKIKSVKETTPSSLLAALCEFRTKGATEPRMRCFFTIIFPCNENKWIHVALLLKLHVGTHGPMMILLHSSVKWLWSQLQTFQMNGLICYYELYTFLLKSAEYTFIVHRVNSQIVNIITCLIMPNYYLITHRISTTGITHIYLSTRHEN
jgi:hypothetical protein